MVDEAIKVKKGITGIVVGISPEKKSLWLQVKGWLLNKLLNPFYGVEIDWKRADENNRKEVVKDAKR